MKGDDLRKDKLVADGAGYTPINISGAAAEQKLRSASGIYTKNDIANDDACEKALRWKSAKREKGHMQQSLCRMESVYVHGAEIEKEEAVISRGR